MFTHRFVFNSLRNADMRIARQVNELAPGQRDRGRKASTFGSDRILCDLNHQGLPFMQNMFDGFGFTVLGVCFKQIRHMQKAGSLKTDVHESALHARQNPHHSSEVNISHQTFGTNAFDEQILKNAVSHHSHSGFARREVD